jgi:hypothetical protein
MNTNFFNIDFRKMSSQNAFQNITRHNLRTEQYVKKSPNQIDKSNDDLLLASNPYRSKSHYRKIIKTKINEYNEKGGKHRMIKENSAFAFTLIIQASYYPIQRDKHLEFLKSSFTFFKERFLHHEIIEAVIHLDEQTPHLHLTISYFDDELVKFNQKGIIELTNLNKVNNDFEKDVGCRFDLKQGVSSKEKKKILDLRLLKQIRKINTPSQPFFPRVKSVTELLENTPNKKNFISNLILNKKEFEKLIDELKRMLKRHVKKVEDLTEQNKKLTDLLIRLNTDT